MLGVGEEGVRGCRDAGSVAKGVRRVRSRPCPCSGGAQVRPMKSRREDGSGVLGGRREVGKRSLLRLANLGAAVCQQTEAELVREGLNLRQAATPDSDKVGRIHREAQS